MKLNDFTVLSLWLSIFNSTAPHLIALDTGEVRQYNGRPGLDIIHRRGQKLDQDWTRTALRQRLEII